MAQHDTLRVGNAAVESEFILRNQQQVYLYCRWRTGSDHDAEELTQETFSRAVRTGRPTGEVEAVRWLKRVAHNILLNDLERRKKERMTSFTPQNEPVSDNDDPARQVEQTDLVERLRDLIAALPAEETTVLSLLLRGLTLVEAAGQLNISISTAKRRRRCAISRLRVKLVGTK